MPEHPNGNPDWRKIFGHKNPQGIRPVKVK